MTIAALRSDISAIRFVISIPPNLSGIVVMFHSDDYISLFVSFFDIPVSLVRRGRLPDGSLTSVTPYGNGQGVRYQHEAGRALRRRAGPDGR